MKRLFVLFLMFFIIVISIAKVSYGAGSERFVFSDLTATDKKTGLTWTRDANIAKTDMTEEDAVAFVEMLNMKKYAGYSDWRLPTRKEIQTLVDYAVEQKYNKPYYKLFNKIGFRNVQPVNYKSSTRSVTDGYSKILFWNADFYDGCVNVLRGRTRVWPVRRGRTEVLAKAGEGRFVFSDLTAIDKKTGLMWTRDVNMAEKVAIVDNIMPWKDALKFVKNLNKQKYAGYSDWRIPTRKEIQKIIDYAVDTEEYKDEYKVVDVLKKIGFRHVRSSTYYWSSTTFFNTRITVIGNNPPYRPTMEDALWRVNMEIGSICGAPKTNFLSVWPVRGGK